MVNRIWHHHFGRGIVATLDNFGKMGDAPTHPELLDWLAVEFMNRGWSIKQMHRLIMTSEAYQMASRVRTTRRIAAKDPENNYLWRFRIQRLDAEIVRDSILAAERRHRLDDRRSAGLPAHCRRDADASDANHGIWKQAAGRPAGVAAQRLRLSQARAAVPDARRSSTCRTEHVAAGARNVSTVPTQALTLMNNEFVLRQAKLFADRVQERGRQRHGEADRPRVSDWR